MPLTATDTAISVVSPFYNRAHLLPAVIDCLESQRLRCFELVIADDGSQDGLADAVASARPSFPLLYIRLDRNEGAASARNAGIDAANGKYIAFLDSDDSWHPDKLHRQFNHLERAADPTMIVSLTRQLVRSRRTYVAPAHPMNAQDDVGSYLFLDGGVIQSSMIFLGAELARAVRFERGGTRHDDWTFALRLQQAGARFEMLEAPLTIYNDESGRERRSPSYSVARLDWLQQWRAELGEPAYLAAAAAVASHLPHSRQVRPLRMIATAMRRRAISPGRASYYALAWAVPPVRTVFSGLRRLWAAGQFRQSSRRSTEP